MTLRPIFFLLVPAIFLILGCASSPEPSSPSPVLEPLDEPSPEAQAELPEEDDEESGDVMEPESAEPKSQMVESPPAYKALKNQLESLGYRGVGLQFESPAVLNFLMGVFSDPRTANLPLKMVYTGMEMAYDKTHQSLTVGGTRDKEKVIRFLLRNSK